jgi:hypothetical protein
MAEAVRIRTLFIKGGLMLVETRAVWHTVQSRKLAK